MPLPRKKAVKKAVKSDLSRPLAAYSGGKKGKSVAKSGAEGESRTHTGISAQRFLRPPRLPFRHFGLIYIVVPHRSYFKH